MISASDWICSFYVFDNKKKDVRSSPSASSSHLYWSKDLLLDLSDESDDSKLGLQDGLNENEEAVEERMKLKRKLQRNRTSFTQEQIDALEEGIHKDFLRIYSISIFSF
jgi:hypothetical protein